MRGSFALPVFLLVVLGLTAQSPAPSQAPAKPLRHIEYAFTLHREGQTEYHFNGIGLVPASGVGGGATNNGGAGTIFVDVLSIAPDGALAVRISELVQLEARVRQAYTCTVYGNTAVLCPSVPAPSEAEWVLLSYLGRQFVDAAPWDSAHHWQRKVDTSQYSLVENFTMRDTSDANVALVSETKKMEMHNGGFGARAEDITITYDRSMEVPKAVHDEMQSTGTRGSSHTTLDFHLTSDSFATPAPH